MTLEELFIRKLARDLAVQLEPVFVLSRTEVENHAVAALQILWRGLIAHEVSMISGALDKEVTTLYRNPTQL